MKYDMHSDNVWRCLWNVTYLKNLVNVYKLCYILRCLQRSQVLSNLFAVKSELSDSKFELKVNDVRFVGHPLRLNPTSAHIPAQAKRKLSTIILFNIVFALKVCVCVSFHLFVYDYPCMPCVCVCLYMSIYIYHVHKEFLSKVLILSVSVTHLSSNFKQSNL